MSLSLLRQPAKSRVWRAYVLACFKCLRAWHACVLTCFCALRANVLASLAYLHAYVLGVLPFLACLQALNFGVLTWSCDDAFSMLACFLSLRARIFYMLAVLKYLTCLHDCVLLWRCLSHFLYIGKVKLRKFSYRKISFYSEKMFRKHILNIYEEVFVKKIMAKRFKIK